MKSAKVDRLNPTSEGVGLVNRIVMRSGWAPIVTSSSSMSALDICLFFSTPKSKAISFM